MVIRDFSLENLKNLLHDDDTIILVYKSGDESRPMQYKESMLHPCYVAQNNMVSSCYYRQYNLCLTELALGSRCLNPELLDRLVVVKHFGARINRITEI